ncbi:MAG: hypothetical protein Q8M15_03315 [Bacteroidota bacterium]|nr:hypothetical protein [Bacteroidota bacterium]
MKFIKYILMICWCGFFSKADAGVEPAVSSYLQGKYFINYIPNPDFISTGAIFTNGLSGFAYSGGQYGFPSTQQVRKIDNLLHLYIDADALEYINFSYKLEVKIEITAHIKGTPSPTIFTLETLVINFNPTERTSFNEKASLHFANAGYVHYRVISAIFTPGLTDAQKARVVKIINLSSEIIIERYQVFDATLVPNGASLFHHHNTVSDELVIWWGCQLGSELFELEWAYVDNYGVAGIERMAVDLKYNKDYNLSRNASRVQLSTNSYVIPMVYERGYIIFRVRFIGKKYDVTTDKVYQIPGQWSDATYGTGPNLSTFTHKLKIVTPHEADKKNWQITTSYSEGGKRKDIVAYMDGTQRNRQTITGLSTEQATLVGESIYDHQGRAAIQVLPVPVPLDPYPYYTPNNRRLMYYNNFNRNNAGSPYSRADFDITQNLCGTLTAPMNTNSGASNYYSGSNPDKTNENAYIPDAKNYPFTQTEFTPDLTGRIRKQGGVGINHQLGSTHETEYYYGTPMQEELFMLFGNEAGIASHYKKNVVKDPNGQLSVSFLNLSGNVIATALAGNPPANLSQLDSYQPDSIDVDLLAYNNKDTANAELISNQSIIVSTQSDYEMRYTVSNVAYQTTLCNGIQLCLDCVYDLHLKVIDNYSCNHVIYDTSLVVGPFTFNDSAMNVNDHCPNSNVAFDSDNLPEPFTINLPVGSYTIIKSLKVNNAAADAYVEHYINRFNTECNSVYNDILNEQLALIDPDACNIEDTAVAENRCDIARFAMLNDLSPGGQYGLINWDDNTATDPTSIFNTSNSLPQPGANWKAPANGGYFDENGVRIKVNNPVTNLLVYPEQLSNLSDFLAIWEESFANSLLPYHPEYCYLDWCSQINSASFDYDVNMTLTMNYNDAIANGFFAPLTNDPYFVPTATHYIPTITSLMSAQLLNYHNTNYSMLQMAVMTSFSAGNIPYTITDINNWISSPASNPAIANNVWETYRAFYISKKEELQYADRVKYAMDHCTSAGGYNECIGANPFNWQRNSFGNFGIPMNGKFFTSHQACSQWTYQLYANKSIRFPAFQTVFTTIDPYTADPNTTIQQAGNYVSASGPCEKGVATHRENCPPTTFSGDIVNLMNQLMARRKFTGKDTINSILNGVMRSDFIPGGKVEWKGDYNSKKFTGVLTAGKKKCEFIIDLPKGISPENFEFITSIIPDTLTINPLTGYTYSAIITIKLINSNITITTKLHNTCYPFSYCKRCPPVIVATKPIGPGNSKETAIKLPSQNSTPAQPVNPALSSQTAIKLPSQNSTPTQAVNPALSSQTALKLPALSTPAIANPTLQNATLLNPVNSSGSINDSFLATSSGTPPPTTGNWICNPCKIISIKYDSAGQTVRMLPDAYSCDPCHPKLDSAITDTIVNQCIEQQVQAAYLNAQNSYQQILDSIRIAFRSLYIEHCLQATETFTAGYMDAMHHFTLYYYNQAGNLVKTIPPVGVVKLNNSQIQIAKNYQSGTSSSPIYNNHGFKSQYWYNSLDQLREQTQPDHDGKSVFFYDYLGRMVASQNPEQKTYQKYSYTLYDSLGRINEVGELNNVTTVLTEPKARNQIQFLTWLYNSSYTRKQITRTRYDEAYTSVVNSYFGGDARNYRGRVASSMYFETNVTTYTNATHYKYDIHGNVKRLVQDLVKLPAKILEYDYDLISGKVNQLSYQPGSADRFIHRYLYDADNRLTQVQTSRDSFVWDNDAVYEYYKHGPLARTVLGQNKVQTQDFTYTIQGWIKGVNSPTLDVKTDPGHDGGPGSDHSLIARDATGYMLRYFTNDYKPIGNGFMYEPTYTGTNYHRQNKDLYNGNIQSMITAIGSPKNSNVAMGTLATAYTYDQLNRITQMQAFTGPNIGTINNSFINSVAMTDYACTYSYDANGNLVTLSRNGTTQSGQQQMDDLDYYYYPGSNRLSYVNDLVASGNYPNDIDAQSNLNYTYDKIGNLKSDNKEGLTINWNVYGKIKTIIKGTANTKFTYGPSGSRVIKEYYDPASNQTTFTFYIHDASGNTLATYQSHANPATPATTRLQSIYIYGSSRLGEQRVDYSMTQLDSLKNTHSTRWNSYRSRGLKYYELSNHLGNVLATISDRKLPENPGVNNPIQFYKADIWTTIDYYPFGSVMPGRVFNPGTSQYGYNGQRTTDEIAGERNHYTAEFWEYDPRAVHRWNMDPVVNPSESPYAINHNNPIKYSDPKGDKPVEGDGDGGDCVTCPKPKAEENLAGKDNLSGFAQGLKITPVAPKAFFSSDNRTELVKQIDQTYTNFVEGDNHWAFKIPVAGSAAQAGRRAAYGEYAGAAASLGMAFLEGQGLGLANSAAATGYLKNAGQLGNFASVDGFSLGLGGTKFMYNSSLEAASKGKWFTSTLFGSSGEAYTKLALGYPQSKNLAQEVYKTQILGLSIKGTAASQGIGVSTGGGIQYMGVFFKKSDIVKIGF